MSIYDQISPIYDWLTTSERPYRQRALQLLAIQAGETLLEIGCGTGQTLLQATPAAGEEGLLVGLDLSAGMLQQAQRNLARARQSKVALLRGTGLALPLAEDCCDAVFLGFTLELFDLHAQHQLLAEIRRVLCAGGRLALVTLSAHKQTAVSDFYWLLHEMLPAVIDCRPIHTAPLLAAAGFTVAQRQYYSLWGLPLSILLAVSHKEPTTGA